MNHQRSNINNDNINPIIFIEQMYTNFNEYNKIFIKYISR